MKFEIEQIHKILNKTLPGFETQLPLFIATISDDQKLLDIFTNKLKLSQEGSKRYIYSYDSEGSKKQILDI